MSYNRLYFDAVDFKTTKDAVEFSPNFICPKCRKYFEDKISADSPRCTLPAFSLSKNVDVEVNFNRQVTFKMPCCGAEIILYVAVHKSADNDDLTFCISVEPIPDGWWQTK